MSADPAQSAPQQLALDLPHRPALELEHFLVSDCNAAAVALIDAWPAWPSRAVGVVGPAGAGKSHLTHVWRLKSGAASWPARDLSEEAVASLETHGAVAVEDIDRGIADERIFFHLLNLAREKSYAVLVTSRTAPGDLEVPLPDLRSRLRALPLAHIAAPDDLVLRAILVKLFNDRQLTVEPHVIGTLALHMDRSFEAAQRLVERCDRLALERQRRVTRAVVTEALAAEGGATKDFDPHE
jgi:chromosomal replication initiation ATPase DnaA